MAKIFLAIFALCVVPSMVAASLMDNPYMLTGSVYCDTCRCGYETSASTYLPGAVVRLECRSRTQTDERTYSEEAVTDSTGHYKFLVHADRGDDVCDTVLVKSSDPECSTPNSGRDRARVILTSNNGMSSVSRFANAMGFLRNTPLASCPQILQQYQETDESD